VRENGEFHTFVFDGPMFAQPLDIEWARWSRAMALCLQIAGCAILKGWLQFRVQS